MKIKLSFKKHPKETGLAHVGNPHSGVDIKIDGKKVGNILPPTWRSVDNCWHIQLYVIKEDIMEDGNPNCIWRAITIGKKSHTEDEARDFLKENIDRICKRYNLFKIGDDE